MNANSCKAFWITDRAVGEIIEQPLPAPSNNEVRVKTLYSGISRGTEALVFTGQVPATEHARMQAPFQEGEFTFPLKYGYINVGIVEHGPKNLIGKPVFSLYPHQTHFNVPESSVTLLPEKLPAARAVLAANMETAINALWDAQPNIGDRISVVGAGVLGALVAYLASNIKGCQVQLIDINPQRQSLAESMGLHCVQPEHAQDNQDLIIHTSASAQGLDCALNLAGFEATVLELSWFGDKPAPIHLGSAFHSQRLQIKSSQVGHIATAQRSRWSYKRRFELALAFLFDDCLDALISGESHFSQLPETMSWLCNQGHTSLCHRIKYDK